MEIRPLTRKDVPHVLLVQEDCYSRSLLEGEEAFACKLLLFPEGCLGAFEDERLVGYVFAHPWSSGEFVPLHEELGSLPETPDCVYIHDLAVLRPWRNRGIADALLSTVFDLAYSYRIRKVALVAVNNSERYWERYRLQGVYSLVYTDGVPAKYMAGIIRRNI